MWTMQDKIEFKHEQYRITASISFSTQMDTIGRDKIPFDQTLVIREKMKDEIFRQMYGHMPKTCDAIKKNLNRCEKEMRELGHKILANKIGSCIALIDSLKEQMTVIRPQSDQYVPSHDAPEHNWYENQ